MTIISKETLIPFLNQGMTVEQIREALDESSRMRVTYAMNKYGLKTKWSQRQADNKLLFKDGKKVCASCDQILSLDQFESDPRSSDNKSSQCKACRAPVINQWQKDNYPKVLAASRRWKERNPEKIQAYSRGYYERTYKNDEELRKSRLKDWHEKNPEAKRAYRITRETRKSLASGSCTRSQFEARMNLYRGLCWICGAPADTVDHVKPLAKGGSQWPANLRPACRSCNSSKGSKWPFDPSFLTRQ